MAEEIKTMAIPAMLDEAQKTGLITQESLDALEAERLLAQERIKNLERLYREKKIDLEYMEEQRRKIQQDIQNMTLALGVI